MPQQSVCLLFCKAHMLYDGPIFDALQGKSDEPASESAPVGTSEDWVALDSGKSFAWSAKQHGSLQQQIEALEKLILQQQQQVILLCQCCGQ